MLDDVSKIKQLKAVKKKESLLALLLMSPFLIVFVLFTVVPIICGFVFSFTDYNPYNSSGMQFIGFQNFSDIFNLELMVSKEFWNSFLTMFAFDAVAVPLMMIIPLVLAYFINLHPPGYKLFRAIIYLPSIVSVTIVGIIFGNMFKGNDEGMINALFGVNIDWLGGKPWDGDILRWVVMLIATIWWQTGTNFVIFSGALRDVPKSLYEASEMDGANRWKRITYVTLPNIRSAMNVCLFNTIIGFLNLYAQPVVLNSGINKDDLVSPMMWIQHYLMGGMTYSKKTGYFCAAAIVFGLIVLIISMLQRKITAPRRKNTNYTLGCNAFIANRSGVQPVSTKGCINEEVSDGLQ